MINKDLVAKVIELQGVMGASPINSKLDYQDLATASGGGSIRPITSGQNLSPLSF